jgi:toxin YoeB
MGKYLIMLKPLAIDHLKIHKNFGNKAVLKKVEIIFRELENHPYTGTGQPEKLKHELAGYYSRRINRKDRIIYKVDEDIVTVIVVSAMGHY